MSDWISLTDAGREFHARDAATGNARSSRVDRRVSGKTSADVVVVVVVIVVVVVVVVS